MKEQLERVPEGIEKVEAKVHRKPSRKREGIEKLQKPLFNIRPRILSQMPLIISFPKVFTAKYCDAVLESGLGFKASAVWNATGGDSYFHEGRTSQTFSDQYHKYDLIPHTCGKLLEGRRDKEDVTHMELVQFQRYNETQEYQPHYDYLNTPNNRGRLISNDRVASMIVYLNDDFEGGETSFPSLDLKVPPKKGSVLYFRYDYTLPQVNELTLHAGMPVTKGTKYIATCWVRQKKYYSER